MQDLRLLTAINSQAIKGRLGQVLGAPSGPSLRAELLEQIENLPPTSPGIANRPFNVKIGIISDLFLYRSFEGLADFQPIYLHNYEDHADIDILLLVSTWRGIDGTSWVGVTRSNGEKQARLFEELLPFYRRLGVPIVFYSKEDPPNYKHFVGFAEHADHIFTSAEEMIPRYQRDCPNAQTIQVLPFGVNPMHHSPIGSQQGSIQRIVPFAGSWFNHKYRDRTRWGRQIFDAVIASDYFELLIMDRNSGLDQPRYRFPDQYSHIVTAAIDHASLLDMQRVADVSINLNSVSKSSTMFANRAIELQAQGTLVLSNYNVGLNSKYPHVHISNGYTDTLGALNNLDETQIRSRQAAGIRSVFSNDLAHMRVAKIISTVGMTAQVVDPRVVILHDAEDANLHNDIERQTYQNITRVLSSSNVSSVRELETEAEVIVRMGTEFEYSPTHVEDLVNAFRYTDALSVEKIVPPRAGREAIKRHYYAGLEEPNQLGAFFIGDLPRNIVPREAYRVDEIGVLERSEIIRVKTTEDKLTAPAVLSVIIPVYNNGAHLLHKCIASLRRSSIFRQMEIILVDDGSEDVATLHALEQLENELSHVQVYRFEPGGSGSASRPRNKGLELATCEYLTYLDPDNEALNDMYVKLLDAVVEMDADFAVGDMTRWRGSHSAVRYTKFLETRLNMDSQVGFGGPDALVDMGFMPISIQALVARTEWLRATGIEQPLGAVGQDSFFFQQMLYYARRFAIVRGAAHTYYAQVENSVVNTVNSKFFQKYLPLEAARSEWLEEIGLIDQYKELRLEEFFVGWYLRKLSDVPEEQREAAIEIIKQLGQMYGKYDWKTDEAIDFWAQAATDVVEQSGCGEKLAW